MKNLLIVLSVFVLVGCDNAAAQKEYQEKLHTISVGTAPVVTSEIVYTMDVRTGLCFAFNYQQGHAQYNITNVPCSPAVVALLVNK